MKESICSWKLLNYLMDSPQFPLQFTGDVLSMEERKTSQRKLKHGEPTRPKEWTSRKGGFVRKIFRHLSKKEKDSNQQERSRGKRTLTQEEEIEKEREDVSELTAEGKNKKTPKGSKKKGRKMVDPFAVPPNKMDLELFRIRNPFIAVVSSDDPVCLDDDKVMDNKNMAPDALRAAMAAMVRTSIETASAFLKPSSESGGRPHHLSIALGFKKVTRPRSTPEQVPTLSEVLKAMVQSCEGFASVSSGEEEDLKVDIEEKVVDLTGCESTESLDVKHEGDEGEMKAIGTKYDLNFMVYDRQITGPDKKITKLIVDCKWVEVSIEAICQAATYGGKHAISNMEKGRYCPIYLEVWGERLWRYAILFPKGIVFVDDGNVKASSGSGIDIQHLQKVLSTKQAYMRRSFRDAVYPDDSYVHGVLYISTQKFTLPNFTASGNGELADTKLFYESKIRMIVGDRALQWTEADVKGIVTCREEELRRKVEDFFEA